MKYFKVFLILLLLLIGWSGNIILNQLNENKAIAIASNYQMKEIEVKPLRDKDFIVEYNEVKFTVGEATNKVLTELGQGTANEKNNFGFIGWDNENKFKFYSHGYPKDTPIIELITKVSVIDGTSIINRVDISKIGTQRNLKEGDSFDKMVELYGEPEVEGKNNGVKYFYLKGNKKLEIIFNKNKEILKIFITLNI